MATATHELMRSQFFHDFMKNVLTIADLSRAFAEHDRIKGQHLQRSL
jgi:hypothetical protein